MKEVALEELDVGMTIVSYCGFGPQYQNMRQEVCIFLRHNFRNTRMLVARQGVKKEIASDDLKPGDSLLKIYHFPAELKKITVVSPGFVQELKKRDMLRFQVKRRKPIHEAGAYDLKGLVQEVEKTSLGSRPRRVMSVGRLNPRLAGRINQMIEKVNRGIKVRDKAVDLIEQAMDRLRRGQLNIAQMEKGLKSLDTSAESMSVIVSLKESELAYDHSIDVGVIFKTVYQKIADRISGPSPFSSPSQILLSGFLHDIGKAKIPKSILHHTGEFARNSRELQVIRSHPLLGARLLEDLNMPPVMVNMARYHHVKKDTGMLNSYPQGVRWEDVAFETRLLTIVDIYQSLVGRRQYKKSWNPVAALRFIDALAGIEFDLKAWSLFSSAMGTYPIGSMVQLNDGSLGFVVNSPEANRRPEKPLVAVTRNQAGEDLSHPHLIDLQVERDVSITADVDYKTVYGNQALDIFASLKVA